MDLAKSDYYVAAFAIEDRVDFRIEDYYNPDRFITISGMAINQFYSYDISTGTNYFETVRHLMKKIMRNIYEDVRGKSDKAATLALFKRIVRIAISCPGVVRDNRACIQLPLWNYINENSEVSWTGTLPDGTIGIKQEFDFVDEIFFILKEVASDVGHSEFLEYLDAQRDHISDTAKDSRKQYSIVVNDVSACAASEFHSYADLSRETVRHGLPVFIKLHDGINVGVIDEGLLRGRPSNAEMGHFFPHLHSVDRERHFMGVCPSHGHCLEGMVSSRSFLERAKRVTVDDRALGSWRAFVDGYTGEDLESALLAHALNTDVGVRIVGHYLHQLVHVLALSPVAPEFIAIGGRMIELQPAILADTQARLLKVMNGYPRRDELTREEIGYYVRQSAHRSDRMELTGALFIAKHWHRRGDHDHRQHSIRQVISDEERGAPGARSS